MAEISFTATVLTASSSSSRESHAYTNNQEKFLKTQLFRTAHIMLLLVSLVVGTFDTTKQFDGKTYSGKYQPTLRYIYVYIPTCWYTDFPSTTPLLCFSSYISTAESNKHHHYCHSPSLGEIRPEHGGRGLRSTPPE